MCPQSRTPPPSDDGTIERVLSAVGTIGRGARLLEIAAVARCSATVAAEVLSMTLAGIHPADLVLIDKRGVLFHAEVVERRERELRVRPLDRRITYRAATRREVLAHWRKSKASLR